jgi:hypothetical protein
VGGVGAKVEHLLLIGDQSEWVFGMLMEDRTKLKVCFFSRIPVV